MLLFSHAALAVHADAHGQRSLVSFLNIYNTILVARLVLTW